MIILPSPIVFVSVCVRRADRHAEQHGEYKGFLDHHFVGLIETDWNAHALPLLIYPYLSRLLVS